MFIVYVPSHDCTKISVVDRIMDLKSLRSHLEPLGGGVIDKNCTPGTSCSKSSDCCGSDICDDESRCSACTVQGSSCLYLQNGDDDRCCAGTKCVPLYDPSHMTGVRLPGICRQTS